MLSLIDKIKVTLGIFTLCSVFAACWGQDAANATEWNAEWIHVLSDESLSDVERLTELTELLLDWANSTGWSNGDNWDRTVELLNAWEESPDIEIARDAYLKILDAIGWSTLDSGAIPGHEPELREYYLRALRITSNPEEESKLLFHLAVSLHRSEPDSLETRRRIEAYLEQASLAAGTLPISADINYLLGSVFAEWGSLTDISDQNEASYYSRAVFHLQQVLSVVGADNELIDKAKSDLEKLLQSGLQLMVGNRYHPEDDIRITVSTRNIPELTIRLTRIPWEMSGMPQAMEKLNSFRENTDMPEIDRVMEKTMPVDMRNRVDWQESELRLGSNIAAGWYDLTVTGDGKSSSSLLLVTKIETVLIPRSNGNLCLWVVDAESGESVADSNYHVLDNAGKLLFSGTMDLSGMAEITTGGDETWAEIHVNHAGNPAVIRKIDLVPDTEPDPWIIPDAITVHPGDRLGWAIIGHDGSAYPYPDDTFIVLPDGARLSPMQETSSTNRRFHVQIPAGVDAYGPIYLTLSNGRSILCSHLKSRQPMPLQIELSGERFSPDRNLFVSSAPVGITIRGKNTGENSGPGYIRILVEMMKRPASFSGRMPEPGQLSDLVFEHITQYGQSNPAEAYWELPEIEQTESPVPIRIKVYPLESDELLAEAYLAMVPYRARISMASSERIIPNGASVMIQVLNVQKGASMTRIPGGELVAFRETWENRYVHRKKGTLLSEEEYNSLPERSLLGSAKTDYRLLERGIVREEVLRKNINPVEKTKIPIVFERHGFYRIEFQARDADIRAHYPDGPLEVWVLPESGDLSTFQSEKPRLIVETTGSGEKEVLVLMDRNNASIMLDLQTTDGRSRTRIIKPESTGYYLLWPGENPSLQVCRAVISGDRQTDFLCHHIANRTQAVWDVRMEQVNGLNPGSEFNWKASIDKGELFVEPVWVIYPEQDGELAEDSLYLQQIEHKVGFECEKEAIALNTWLPLIPPIGVVPQADKAFVEPVSEINDLNFIGVIYPEMQQESAGTGGFVDLLVTSDDPSEPEFELSGTLPLTAGRWSLLSFGPGAQNSINLRSWLFSTELPIRTTISGPPVMRIGDTALATLVAENTTRSTLQVALQPELEGAIQGAGSSVDDIELPSQHSVVLPVEYQAVGPGDGRLSTTVMGSLSSSTAFLNTKVEGTPPVPFFKSHLAREGFEDWEESIDLTGCNSVEVLVSSGIGAHLRDIWPAVRQRYLQREPLLTELTDWALEKVWHHHGLTGSVPVKAKDLNNILNAYSSESGISWTPGNKPDPWLSAMVLWTIETFSHLSDEEFLAHRERMRNYLESVLISDSTSIESRIFALRTLAAQANHDPRIRPSRIQAKSFLEFFHNMDRLSLGETVMLMDVARSFRLIQEVRLLTEYLKKRLNSVEVINGLNLWEASLVYLAISQESGSPELKVQSLEAVVENAGNLATRPGWEQIGSFLNFLAAFLWEGDFSVDGFVSVRQGELDPIRVPLKPHGENAGELMLTQSELQLRDSRLQLGMDTSLSNQPVVVTVLGVRDIPAPSMDYPSQWITFAREYMEHTLLAGSHVHSVESNLDSIYHPKDTLVQRIVLDVEEPQPYAEFTFSIPSGARLSNSDIKYEVNPVSGEAILADPVVTFQKQPDPLLQRLRIEPLSPGVHVFELLYRVNWSGTYAFPSHQVFYPKSGDAYRLGTDGVLRIVPAKR